jgi:ADP-ribosylglycohydrolase/fructose-1,6-bisphosphatase/inositol monophosphatase family enzyme
MIELDAVLRGVIAAVEQEAALLLAEFNRPQGPRGRHASAPIDTEIEDRLAEALCALVPGAFVGEETEPRPGTLAGWTWLVDPHDGTKQFLEARRGSAISVGLLREGVPVLGVVCSPNAADVGWDTVAWAEDCGPVTRNGVPVGQRLEGRALAAREHVWATASAALRPITYSHAVAPARYVAMPSIAYRLARVAGGDGVAAISLHSVSEYDIAAGAALVRGAGGVTLDAEGHEIRFTGLPGARVSGCYSGARDAVAALASFDWKLLEREARSPLRTPSAFPAVADATRLSRGLGCLLGQAIGDSLGALVEFRPAAEIAEKFPHGVRELADGGSWGAMAGQPTDDTELALSLARSLVAEHGFDPNVVRVAYRKWMASNPFDIGSTTRHGLLDEHDDMSQSNGSLMRVSPLGLWAAGDPRKAASAARDDSLLTHRNPACVDSCAAFCAALAVAIGGGSREQMLDAARAEAHLASVREAIERAVRGERPADFQAHQGWVLLALQEAFFQLLHAPSLEEGLVDTVSQGGDADTNGAIAGALLGAFHGREALPRRWVLPVLACRPCPEADAFRPRPRDYWPDDILELGEALLRLA